MKEDVLISVIVPIYKVEKYLDRCIESLVNQTYQNLEIILVDDGSPDNCPQMCDDWAKKDSRTKVIHKENGGLSDARNAGMQVATGDLIAYIDSDDWIDTDAFEKMYLTMQSDNSDIVSCGVKWVAENGTLLHEVTVKQNEALDTACAMSEIIADGKLKQHVWNKLYRRRVVEDIPFEKGKYHEDVFWSYQTIGRANKVSLMAESFYNYVQRSDSIMGENYSVKRLDALDAMQQRCQYVKEHFPDLYNQALYTYIGSCMYHLQCALRSKQDAAVIENIVNRVDVYKTGNPVQDVSRKQKIWLELFIHFPIFTAKLRNTLKVGI